MRCGQSARASGRAADKKGWRGKSVARDPLVVGIRGGPYQRCEDVHAGSPSAVGDAETRGDQPQTRVSVHTQETKRYGH